MNILEVIVLVFGVGFFLVGLFVVWLFKTPLPEDRCVSKGCEYDSATGRCFTCGKHSNMGGLGVKTI